jgi:hypothetical protein
MGESAARGRNPTRIVDVTITVKTHDEAGIPDLRRDGLARWFTAFPSQATAWCYVECDENATVPARAVSSVLMLTNATMP